MSIWIIFVDIRNCQGGANFFPCFFVRVYTVVYPLMHRKGTQSGSFGSVTCVMPSTFTTALRNPAGSCRSSTTCDAKSSAAVFGNLNSCSVIVLNPFIYNNALMTSISKNKIQTLYIAVIISNTLAPH